MSEQDRISDQKTVEMFVVRARRITEHSLFKNRELFRRTRQGQIQLARNTDPAADAPPYLWIQELPDEELLESLAARIRPVLLAQDRVFYAKVLNALGRLVSSGDLEEVAEPIRWWKKEWKRYWSPDDATGMAYTVITERGIITDRKLMDRWLHGDLVHADDLSASTLGVSIEGRYQAAAGIVIRIADLIERMLVMIEILNDRGALSLPPEVFTERVTVGTTRIVRPTEARFAAEETEMPTSLDELDPAVWRDAQEISNELNRDDLS